MWRHHLSQDERLGNSTYLTIRIECDDLNELKAEARKLRIPPTVYARSILIQALQRGAESKK
jgi:hypothetical protein